MQIIYSVIKYEWLKASEVRTTHTLRLCVTNIRKGGWEDQSPFYLSYLLLHIYPNPLGAQAFARNGQGDASLLHGRAQHHKCAALPYVVDGIDR